MAAVVDVLEPVTPLVSVVVPSRGGAQRLPVLLGALARQVYPRVEVVVVLDGDVDDSAGLLEEWNRDNDGLQVDVVRFAENQGRAAALNAGFAAATGEILVRCDDDLVPTPDYVAAHAAGHQRDLEQAVGWVGMCRNVFPETPYARVYGRPTDRSFRHEAYRASAEQTWRYWGGNVSVTQATWERIGPYDTMFRAYGWEDADWGYRLAEAGVPVVIDPAAEAEHRIAATTTRIRVQRAYASGAAKHLFDRKHRHETPLPEPTSAWNRAVRGLARLGSETRVAATAGVLDRLLPVLPASVGRRLIGLLVEAAFHAGYRAGKTRGGF